MDLMGLFACINTLETVNLKVVPLGFASTWLSFPSFDKIFRLSSDILTIFQTKQITYCRFSRSISVSFFSLVCFITSNLPERMPRYPKLPLDSLEVLKLCYERRNWTH